MLGPRAPILDIWRSPTTRHSGDIVPVERWRLLGPITAMNGVLLFGWSTAVIFEVLRRTLVVSIDMPEEPEIPDGR